MDFTIATPDYLSINQLKQIQLYEHLSELDRMIKVLSIVSDKTEDEIRELPSGNIVQIYSDVITNLLDVGCGDWTWMSEVRLSCNYIGIDLVDSVIEQNINKYGASNRSFQVLDAVVDPLPTCDAILLREVIFHLSFSDIDNIFRNIITTNPSYIFITSDPEVEINNDIVSGDFRMLNLEKKPFYLPKPFIYIDDSNVMNSTRYIGVWKVRDLRANFKK